MGSEPGVVIELGAIRPGVPEEPDPPRSWTRRRFRPAALALAAVLTLVIGGAAPPAPPVLTAIASLQLGPAPMFLLTTDRVFVSAVPAGSPDRVVAAYDLRDGRQLWSTSYPAKAGLAAEDWPWLDGHPAHLGGGSVHLGGVSVHLQRAPGLLLITRTVAGLGTPRVQTDGLDERTGRLRWSVPYPVEILAGGRLGLTTEEVFRADSTPGIRLFLPDRDSTRSGSTRVYFAQPGQTRLEPPLGVRAGVLDLASGESRWVSPLVQQVDTVGGMDEMLMVRHIDGAAEVVETATGQLRHHFPGPVPGSGVSSVSTDDRDDLLLLNSGSRVTAYSTQDWQPRWTRILPSGDHHLLGCGPLLCQLGGDPGVIDPATGQALWPLTDQTQLDFPAGHLVELDGFFTPSRTVEPRTGRTLIDLAGWERIYPAEGDTPALLTRMAGEGTWLGLLEPGATTVRPLAPVPYLTLHCQPGPSPYLACQTADDSLRIWRYR